MAQTNLGNMFRLFSTVWEPVSLRQADLVVSGTLQSDAKVVWEALGLPAAPVEAFADDLSSYLGRDANEVMHELRREETRLFLTPQALVANTEGIWRKKAEGYKIVSFMINSYSLEVADFMRQCGVVKAQDKNECLDYVHTECEFAGMLADGPEYLAKAGKDPIALLDQFVEEHLTRWLPGFCADVARETASPYHTASAAFFAAFLRELQED